MLSSRRRGSSTVRVMKLRLNAPYGARCFLTYQADIPGTGDHLGVLMHLMALVLEGCLKMSHAIRLPLLQDLKLYR